MEQITGNDDQLGFLLQEIVDRAFEDFGDIDLTLVRALRRLPVELAEPQMQVGEVGELHCKRIVVWVTSRDNSVSRPTIGWAVTRLSLTDSSSEIITPRGSEKLYRPVMVPDDRAINAPKLVVTRVSTVGS